MEKAFPPLSFKQKICCKWRFNNIQHILQHIFQYSVIGKNKYMNYGYRSHQHTTTFNRQKISSP